MTSERAPAAGRPPGRGRRYLFYSHDGLGLGHVRRNLAIARALTALDPTASVLLVSGSREAERLGVPRNVDVLRLPALRKLGNERYAARRLPISSRDVRGLRSGLLAAAVRSFEPAVVLVDKHPVGAGGELGAALEHARVSGARMAFGLRDILDDPAVVVDEWARTGVADRIAELYHRVLVYGQAAVHDPVRAYRLPPLVAARARFCGYVHEPEPPAADGALAGLGGGRPAVLATVGGGEDGFELLRAFVEAAAGASWAAAIVTGPDCSELAARRLRRLAVAAGVGFRSFVPGLARLFASVDALVCMGGYNTLTEAVASGVRTVCVPRAHPRQEQLLRARAFARLGAVRMIEPERLSAETLRCEVERALRTPPPRTAGAGAPIDLSGARRAAGHLLELAAEATPAGRRLHAAG